MHNLNTNNGKASMFYTGEVPWHQLGTQLEYPATAAEAIEAAGLDFTVQKIPLKAVVNGRLHLAVERHFATLRTDTNQVLGVVGSRYEIVQNRDAFVFFDPLVDRSESIYHSAGVLGKGEKVWILAKLPDYIRIGQRGDPIEKYLLLYNSHDGSSNIRIKLTPIRVVCQNTLAIALSGHDEEIRIRHTANAPLKLEEAHALLGLTNSLYKQLESIFNHMALRNITDKTLLTYVNQLIPDNPTVESHARTGNMRKRILDIHESEDDAIHRGTVFGIYNAVTQMVDHHVSKSSDPSKHLKSIWFGAGEQLKIRAFVLAEELLMN